MAYFRELSNISAPSLLPDRTRSDERVLVKNIFKRGKLRTDVANMIQAYEYRTIEENERPDNVAAKVYDDPELDWVILITNNIINVRDEWPLSNADLYEHMIDKYGSDQALYDVHHYETFQIKDEYNRIILFGGLEVDEDFSFTYRTRAGNLFTETKAAGPVTNFAYETRKNDGKRIIRILKKEFVGAMVSDLRSMMKYETSSQFIDRTTKATYNPREIGV